MDCDFWADFYVEWGETFEHFKMICRLMAGGRGLWENGGE
jgi:hypothetical protein